MTGEVHLVGIGGAGMSAIAKILISRGERVRGSDRERSAYAQALEAMGVPVVIGHRAENITDASLVVASSAIPENNVELAAARAAGIPVLRRKDFLSDIVQGKRVVAVAGTHGKTTTTALIACILQAAGKAPSFIVGGQIRGLGTNAQWGEGQDFVIEADEYDRTFLGLEPWLAVVTNVEHDHPDCYPTEAEFKQAFQAFADQVQGLLVVCAEDPGARTLVPGKARLETYGMEAEALWRADEIRPNSAGGSDFLISRAGETLGLARSRLPGRHNVLNVLAAFAASSALGVEFAQAREALTSFQGVGRRFEILGTAGGVTVIDDYAHHPTEIQATLQAARQRYPQAGGSMGLEDGPDPGLRGAR
ncbi:MAG TPA: UDP-N-acetylmuramate--L-alanine ligase, partial [Chloroflexi bacterium]|nr:UDP-N-acetylmuramate--L-alanine ligase [Chloroflexota bacterium]